MTEREREDRKRVAQLGLACLGAAMLLGSVAGSMAGLVRVAAEALHDGGDDDF